MKAIDILKNEHRQIERMLLVLETASNKAMAGESVSPKVFQDAIRFIKEFADGCHHHKEEDLLFPAMEEKGFPREGGPIGVMLHEHDLGRSFVKGMVEALDGFGRGNKESLQQLTQNAGGFIALLRQHIMKEDSILFEMASRHLDENEQSILTDEFARVEGDEKVTALKKELLDNLSKWEIELGQAR